MKKTASNNTNFHGVGRRKSSVARVWMKNGKGKILVNGKDFKEYFDTNISKDKIVFPGNVVGRGNEFDVNVNVFGGGKMSQADAIKLGISRAFLEIDSELRPILKKQGLLTVDSRLKERKKYGQKAARRKFQFVKR